MNNKALWTNDLEVKIFRRKIICTNILLYDFIYTWLP